MYCPQCGTESQATLQYCRVCGANLKVIGKAVALSEAIARSDRGPLPKLKEMVKNLKVDQVTEEVSRALDRMNNEIIQSTPESKPNPKTKRDPRSWPSLLKKKTAAERREKHITNGIVSMFSGAGLTIFLYYLSAALVLKLPPDVIRDIPFEIAPVIKILWAFGLIPTLHGLGNIVAGLLIRPETPALPVAEVMEYEQVEFPRQRATTSGVKSSSVSVTEHTTNLLS
jgi:hypothetical protein